MRAAVTVVVLAALAAGSGCGGPARAGVVAAPQVVSSAAAQRSSAAQQGGGCARTVVAAGDIVNDVTIADRTGAVAAAQNPDRVLVLGDNQYPTGSLSDYRSKYDRTAWGALKPKTKPVPGNHEYRTAGASGYFTYFGNPAPYYAFDLGCGWRGYALNSEIDLHGQVSWLRRDLDAHPQAAVLAFWHRPRWSSGTHHGSNPAMQPLWDTLAGRKGLVLNGHEHNYERFAPVNGMREFVVGTGGTSTYPFGAAVTGSERRIAATPGVLRVNLSSQGAYTWAFLTTRTATLDSGRG